MPKGERTEAPAASEKVRGVIAKGRPCPVPPICSLKCVYNKANVVNRIINDPKKYHKWVVRTTANGRFIFLFTLSRIN